MSATSALISSTWLLAPRRAGVGWGQPSHTVSFNFSLVLACGEKGSELWIRSRQRPINSTTVQKMLPQARAVEGEHSQVGFECGCGVPFMLYGVVVCCKLVGILL